MHYVFLLISILIGAQVINSQSKTHNIFYPQYV